MKFSFLINKMKIILTLCFAIFIFIKISYANMASPIREGTKSADVFSSKDIDILKEKLSITINKEFTDANFTSEYFIRTDKEGKQIPLMFFAINYKDDFRVWVDGVEIKIISIPQDYLLSSGIIQLDGFSNSFNSSASDSERKVVRIQFEKNSAREYVLSELKYFEADLSKGDHKIRVEYTAIPWKDRSEWVNKYTMPYSLSPARHWRSFGELEIILNAEEFGKYISTNIGQPDSGNANTIAVWNFRKLPDVNVLEIEYTPEINSFTKAMIAIDPFGLTIIAGLILTLFHFIFIRDYRIRKPEKKFSWILIAGSIIIPFLILVFYILSYGIIDSMIGKDAGGYHGYTFLVLIFYPVILIVYFLIMWITDRIIKKRYLKKELVK